jgi:hypothetical protein
VQGQWSLRRDQNIDIGEPVSGYTNGKGEAKLDSARFVETGTLYFKVTEKSNGGEPIPFDNTEANIHVP